MNQITHAKLVIDESNQAMHAQTKEQGLYFELVDTLVALADDEEIAISDEQFHEILAAADKSADEFVADAIALGGK